MLIMVVALISGRISEHSTLPIPPVLPIFLFISIHPIAEYLKAIRLRANALYFTVHFDTIQVDPSNTAERENQRA